MPIYNRFVNLLQGNQLDPQALMMVGPILNVEISIPTALANLYSKTGISIPQPISGLAILDTGAYRTSVDNKTITSLGVQPVGLEPTLTPSGRKNQNTYPAHVKFPGTTIDLDFNEALGADLEEQKVNNQPIIALVGRDILSQCVFIYNGAMGTYTLAH